MKNSSLSSSYFPLVFSPGPKTSRISSENTFESCQHACTVMGHVNIVSVRCGLKMLIMAKDMVLAFCCSVLLCSTSSGQDEFFGVSSEHQFPAGSLP